MEFKQRLTAPDESNKYYRHTSVGGYNKCIVITSSGSCLPNCVGYVWGRALESWGMTTCNLSRANAEMWYVANDGYKRGQTPKVGSICCYSKGVVGNASDGAGHVAFVEAVESDGTITLSNSAYNGTRFFLRTVKPPYTLNGYKLQGFIYPPVEFDGASEVVTPTKTIDELAKEVIRGDWGNGADRKQRLTSAGYNYSEVQKRVDEMLSGSSSQPTTPTTTTTTYKVVKGDNLTKIAKKYNSSVNAIVSANKVKYPKITPNYIQVGWVLDIPSV